MSDDHDVKVLPMATPTFAGAVVLEVDIARIRFEVDRAVDSWKEALTEERAAHDRTAAALLTASQEATEDGGFRCGVCYWIDKHAPDCEAAAALAAHAERRKP